MNPKNVADDLVRMIFHLDEPLADPAPLNALYISELARKMELKFFYLERVEMMY